MTELHGATKIRSASRIDLVATLSPLQHGHRDATMRIEAGRVARATWTPEGAATVLLRATEAGIEVDAWGPGAPWAIAHAGDLCGANDSVVGFAPVGIVADIHRRYPGLRIPRARTVFACLWPAILEQKVTGMQARRALAGILRAWGHAAPGPLDLRLPPRADELATKPYYDFHPFGVERRRADVIRGAAQRASRLERLVDVAPPEARRALEKLPGIGVWTSAEVGRHAFGDADAVSVGDYHLPNVVAWNLAGEARADDARMLELLAPYDGHRGRVQRLLELGGRSPPRYGPRLSVRPLD